MLPLLNPCGLLKGCPDRAAGVHGLWTQALNFNPTDLYSKRLTKGFSASLDTLLFSQMLAKIAHSFSAADIGLTRFNPTLVDFILNNYARDDNDLSVYNLVGGLSALEPATMNLHEVGWTTVGVEALLYILVRIRLFALLGAPTYYVIAGYITDSDLFGQLSQRGDN
jgi:hypothetical protein